MAEVDRTRTPSPLSPERRDAIQKRYCASWTAADYMSVVHGKMLDHAHDAVLALLDALEAAEARATAAEVDWQTYVGRLVAERDSLQAKVDAALAATEHPSGIWPFGITNVIAALTDSPKANGDV